MKETICQLDIRFQKERNFLHEKHFSRMSTPGHEAPNIYLDQCLIDAKGGGTLQNFTGLEGVKNLTLL